MLAKPKNPHLPFGDQQTAPWYGKDIISVKQFSRADLEYIFGVAHEMRVMVERVGTLRPAQGQDPGQPLLRALDADVVLVHRGHGAARRQRHPHQRGPLLLGGQGREPARHDPDPRVLRRRHRHPPSRSSARRPWRPRPPASRSSTPATASASTPPRPCSTPSPSTRSWAGWTT